MSFEETINNMQEELNTSLQESSPEEEEAVEEVEETIEGGDEQEQETTEYEVDVNELNTTIEALQNKLQQTEQNNQLLNEKLQLLISNRGQQPQQPQVQEESTEENSNFELPPDFDTMGQRELVQFVINEVKKDMSSQIEPIKSELNKTKKEQKYTKLEQQVINASKKYSDFDTFIPKMKELAQQGGVYSSLNPEELYFIAKGTGQPAQGKQTTKPSYLKPRTKTKPKPTKAATEKPTSSTQTTRQEGKMSRTEAFDEAWKRIMEARD